MVRASADGSLAPYRRKRDFARSPEPEGGPAAAGGESVFVIQKHAASRLHYDFRLELDGVLVSWAVPKGPSLDPADKRIAVHVEDHPLAYASFEGTIPRGHYGAGTVIVWDNGRWEPVGDPRQGMSDGKLVFDLRGHKLAGRWELVRIAKPGDRQDLWILFKKRDRFARPSAEYDVVRALPDSVIARPLTAPEADTDRARPARRGRKAGDPVEGAVKAELPDKLAPQLATLATGVPAAGEWVYEIKFDGYRLMCRIRDGQATLFTRGGHDWSAKLPALVADLEKLALKTAWLDGEIVVLGDDGLPSFHALQNAIDRRGGDAAIRYFVFDLPYLDGRDLRPAGLVRRRRLLKALLDERGGEHLRFSADFGGDPATVLQSACQSGLEGVIAKRADAPYASGRTETWLKLKCKLRQEFVVCGYTDRSDGSPQIGSLLLGWHDERGDLVSAGSVGTGWDAAEAAALKKRLSKIEIEAAPFAAGVPKRGRWQRRAAGAERWVAPRLVAEVEYREMTPDGQIRHASYVALRADTPARRVRREVPAAPAAGAPLQRAAAGRVKVTHADRIVDASSGLSKLDLVRYYESVADFMLPHLRGRPCSLVRGPDGVGGQLFFQKHAVPTALPGVAQLDAALWPGHAPLLEVGSARALAGAAQMNVIEFHTWNATARHIDAPDRMVFDLDPGEGVAWPQVQEAAMLVHGLLNELGLQAWLKTSGGKGLHVVVPLAPKLGHEVVKAFSQTLVKHLARVIPSRFVAKSGPSNRTGRIFVDYLRNAHGATTVAAFSARARPGLGVSMPLAWDDLPKLKSAAQWTVATAREHLSFQTTDPWAGYWKKRQTLTAAMKTLGFEQPPPSR